jgi:Na+-driven multidrug efflux pump
MRPLCTSGLLFVIYRFLILYGSHLFPFVLKNRKAVCAVIKTGTPLSLGYFIEYGEWEVLTIFAAALGPAEVAAWGLIGTVWSTFESLTNGIGNGGEVRCAYHLGAGNPAMARVSAYKSILLGVVASCFFTSILFIVGEDMAVWLTPDPTLQHMIAELLPLLGIGNVALTAGTVAWALVGSQGRYRLATLIAFIFSWGVTMPMSATFTFVAKFNLQGITAAVVMGYSVTGTALIYILLRSDWERLSQCAMDLNDFEDEELEHLRPEDEIKAKESTVAASRVELDVDASC